MPVSLLVVVVMVVLVPRVSVSLLAVVVVVVVMPWVPISLRRLRLGVFLLVLAVFFLLATSGAVAATMAATWLLKCFPTFHADIRLIESRRSEFFVLVFGPDPSLELLGCLGIELVEPRNANGSRKSFSRRHVVLVVCVCLGVSYGADDVNLLLLPIV